ncbi:hypothetical protein ABZP36_003379 [Zizania latifolia]
MPVPSPTPPSSCLYDLANVAPTFAKFYHEASESYEQACAHHISSLIYLQFEGLFQFSREVDEYIYTIAAEGIRRSQHEVINPAITVFLHMGAGLEAMVFLL